MSEQGGKWTTRVDGTRLVDARQRMTVAQKTLARMARVAPTTISNMEHKYAKQRFKVSCVRRVAEAAGLDVREFAPDWPWDDDEPSLTKQNETSESDGNAAPVERSTLPLSAKRREVLETYCRLIELLRRESDIALNEYRKDLAQVLKRREDAEAHFADRLLACRRSIDKEIGGQLLVNMELEFGGRDWRAFFEDTRTDFRSLWRDAHDAVVGGAPESAFVDLRNRRAALMDRLENARDACLSRVRSSHAPEAAVCFGGQRESPIPPSTIPQTPPSGSPMVDL